MVTMLTSLQNPLVKSIRKLHQAKGRRSQGEFLLEGTHLVQEALAVHYPLTTVCYTASWQTRHEDVWERLTQREFLRLELVSPEVLAGMATTVQPDGVVAIAPRRPDFSPPAAPATCSLGLVLATIQDPGNLGTMIRTAAAAGVDQVWLSSDSVDLDHPKVLRASAGQWFRTPLQVCADVVGQVQQCQAQGMQVLATRPDATASYWDVDLRSPTLLLVGNEGAGLSAELTGLADLAVQIPVAAAVESLNVAIATALILYEANRQRTHAR